MHAFICQGNYTSFVFSPSDHTCGACAGADRHPELLSDLFACLSNIFKHLNKHVAPQLSSVLRSSARLRYSEAAHVRQLAADAFGYLFRHVSQSGLKSGVQTLLAEQALQPSSGEYTCCSAFLPETRDEGVSWCLCPNCHVAC